MAKQMSKEEQHINVYVRIRPYSCFENKNKYSSFLEVLSKKEILSKSNYNHKRYVFDRVFDSHCSQEDIYNTIVSPLIPEVIGGYNCTVFAYGQTGTGKTYTMQGIHDKDNQVNSGIIPRSLAQIFKILNVTNTESSVKVSYLELYNEELFDLLSQSNASKAIRIFEDKMQKGSVILQGLEELSVTELNQVYKILEQGSEKRRIASTDMNSTSSRSHTVFTIVVHTREIMIDGEELVKTGKLNLVDLAGSENISKSGAIDKRAREAGNINQSLLTLGRVIKALTEKNTHVPYRESKLTRILQDSLGGRTKTSLIATISSTNVNMEETLNTLEYAMRARCIQNRPELNQKISRTALINQYTDTIEKLQKDLVAMRTGTGVYIDEDNYTKLMSDNEAQKVEISEKMSYIKKLEIEISEYTDKLHTLQASWKEAANNIEQLSNEKKILEQDLVLVKEVNEQQIKELQEFKHKHKHLADETKKLLSDIEIHAVNEDTLHKKVSYLYQTSQNNRNITSAFYSMYNKLFTELISQIDKSVVFVLKLMVNAEYLLENTSEDTYNNIKSHINNLLQLSTDIREYKVMYFNNKELLMTRFCGYFDALQKLADCIQNKSVKFCNEFDENLKSLHDIVSSFSTEKKCDFRIIISSLINIRETASSEFLIMSKILQEFHDDIIKNIDDLLFHMEKLNNKLFENYDIITALEEELDNNFHMLINSLTTMKNKCTSNLSMYKNSNAEVINNSSDLLKKIQKFKKTTKWSMDMLRNESISKLDMLQKSVNQSIISSNQINDNVHLVKKEILQSIAQCSNNALNLKNDMNDYFIGYNSSATNYHSEINQLESVDDEHNTNLNKLVNNIYLQTENVKTTSEEIISQHKTLKKHFEVLTKETTNVLKDGQTFSSNTSKDLKSLLDEFCGCKLKHPTHAGDTPQKVLPKSSLRIESLTRNCFNACNKEKAIDVIEEPNKENSSNVLNIMPTAENISNTQEIHLWEYMNKNI